MSGKPQTQVYRAAPGVYWAVEQGCTLVVNELRSEVFRLAGLEQMVWDCLVLKYLPDQVRQMAAMVGKLEPEAAGREIQAILQEWRSLGLVEMEGPRHG